MAVVVQVRLLKGVLCRGHIQLLGTTAHLLLRARLVTLKTEVKKRTISSREITPRRLLQT